MTATKKPKKQKLRNAEYYNLQETFDTLFADSKNGKRFTKLMPIIRILHYLMENPVQGESIEFNDNRLALYCAQQGKCAVTGKPLSIGDIHCHHKTRKADDGDDRYSNLVLVCADAHILLHATKEDTIKAYTEKLSLDYCRNRISVLPTIARELKLSQSTVRRALQDLRKAGLLETEQRYRKHGGKSSLLYSLKR